MVYDGRRFAPETVTRLLKHLEVLLIGLAARPHQRVAELRQTVTSALVYPSILLFVAGLSVILLLVFVVPQFTVLFEDMGAALPLPTRIVIAVGDLPEAQGALLVALASRMNSQFGATEDYTVTREFARLSTPQERQRLLRVHVDGSTGDAARPQCLHQGWAVDETAFTVDLAAGRIAGGSAGRRSRSGGRQWNTARHAA